MSDKDTVKTMLHELALHLSHDAAVNGSKFSSQPQGRLVISVSDGRALFGRALTVLSNAEPADQMSAEYRLTQLLLQQLRESTSVSGPHQVGSIPLDMTPGSLWRKIIDVLGGEPDTLRGVVAPIILRHLTRQAPLWLKRQKGLHRWCEMQPGLTFEYCLDYARRVARKHGVFIHLKLNGVNVTMTPKRSVDSVMWEFYKFGRRESRKLQVVS